MLSPLIAQIEAAIRRDPARRGLLSDGDWMRGSLEPAAASLLESRGDVAIVTGFAVPTEQGLFAETDGPPGAVILADVLARLGRRVVLITDEPCRTAVETAAESAGLGSGIVQSAPIDPDACDLWIDEFFQRLPNLSHLIAIERPGPSHTVQSAAIQPRSTRFSEMEFGHRVPIERQSICHNMRGERLDDLMAPLYRLFERVTELPAPITTIGIGDGGNEIGMGLILWEDLASRLTGLHRGWVPCRVATTWTIVCGVSNWGGLGLAAAVANLAGRPELILAWDELRQRRLLIDLVDRGPAVDGVTRLQTATVDGLADDDNFGPWREIVAAMSVGV